MTCACQPACPPLQTYTVNLSVSNDGCEDCASLLNGTWTLTQSDCQHSWGSAAVTACDGTVWQLLLSLGQTSNCEYYWQLDMLSSGGCEQVEWTSIGSPTATPTLPATLNGTVTGIPDETDCCTWPSTITLTGTAPALDCNYPPKAPKFRFAVGKKCSCCPPPANCNCNQCIDEDGNPNNPPLEVTINWAGQLWTLNYCVPVNASGVCVSNQAGDQPLNQSGLAVETTLLCLWGQNFSLPDFSIGGNGDCSGNHGPFGATMAMQLALAWVNDPQSGTLEGSPYNIPYGPQNWFMLQLMVQIMASGYDATNCSGTGGCYAGTECIYRTPINNNNGSPSPAQLRTWYCCMPTIGTNVAPLSLVCQDWSDVELYLAAEDTWCSTSVGDCNTGSLRRFCNTGYYVSNGSCVCGCANGALDAKTFGLWSGAGGCPQTASVSAD